MATEAAASERLHAIAARMRVEADRGAARRMSKVLRGSVAPLIAQVRGAAYVSLPRRGGLNEEQGNQPIRVSIVSSGARTSGIRIRTRTPGSMQTNDGYVRHPVFGKWLKDQPDQPVPAATGWWTETLRHGSAAMTPLIVAEMNRVGRFIQYGAE